MSHQDDKKYVVTRTVIDDGTYHGQTQYLKIEKHFGIFEWIDHAAHANKMRFLDAVTFQLLAVVAERESKGDPEDYTYSFQQQA